ncbi:FAD-dependent 5-carboxymethylaminomethyl-2-thiouridine(34) oxidoreductase MnmC [Alphaproteobacteria bacterium]|nr:FAD-dependent 5-carboxymethylaminomethyl-2-thiouridine(34) oxidoreductase MnmC [Alphaproteobacteria bacterium]
MTQKTINHTSLPVYKMPVPDAKISDGVLRSRRFKDIYFSSEDGLAETQHVFIKGTNLNSLIGYRSQLTIAETGFGTGLNFLAVLDLLEKSGSDCRIDYISFEAYPLDAEVAFEARKPFADIQTQSRQLKHAWPERWACAHHRLFLQDKVHLHLHYGDALASMQALDFKANIWFLDGFSPAKNAALWSEELFFQVTRLSSADARLASFSVASIVKKGLQNSGFKIEKKQGFGKKREMLTAVLKSSDVVGKNIIKDKNVVIIGGGIAGASMAAGLRAVGIPHIILEAAPNIAAGASGNPAGLQTPQLMAAPHPSMQMSLSCFSYARALAMQEDVVLDRGVISLNYPEKQGKRQQKMVAQSWPEMLVEAVDATQISNLANLDIQQEGYFQSVGHLISPAKLTQQLLSKSEVICGVTISKLEKCEDMWQVVTDAGDEFLATDIILSVGAGLPQFLEKYKLPSLNLQVTSGQLSFLPENTEFSQLKSSVQFGGYLTPMIDGMQILGASFDLSGSMEITDDAHLHNISLLPQSLQMKMPAVDSLNGRVSQRLASQDRGPLMGDWYDNIHLFSALGSRGLTNAPLLGLMLARKIARRPVGFDRDILRILDPHRFSMRVTRTKSRN